MESHRCTEQIDRAVANPEIMTLSEKQNKSNLSSEKSITHDGKADTGVKENNA